MKKIQIRPETKAICEKVLRIMGITAEEVRAAAAPYIIPNQFDKLRDFFENSTAMQHRSGQHISINTSSAGGSITANMGGANV